MVSARALVALGLALGGAFSFVACGDEAPAEGEPRDAATPPPRDARSSSSSGSAPGDAGRADAAVDAGIEPDAEADAAPDAAASFGATVTPLSAELRARMTNVTWREGCPVGLDDLSLLEMSYLDFTGVHRQGQMVVATRVAEDVVDAFRQIYDAHFPIAKMVLLEEYDGDDDRSMADNNSSAFNCRRITGGTSYSQHSYGTAIDINPVQNPYIKGSVLEPPAGLPYKNRADVRSGMIVDGSAPLTAFDALEWGWGGRFSTLKDYQHFSEANL